MQTFPPSNLSRAELDAWVRENAPSLPANESIPHEAPLVENGPSLVCNACSIVRVGFLTPFCKGCATIIDGCT
jgi:hypothetical protein